MARSTVTANNYQRCVAITTSDATNIATGITDAIMITAAGNIVFLDSGGNTTTVTGALVGSIYPINVVRVNATGTTASSAALYFV